jgi:hypothetical protein
MNVLKDQGLVDVVLNLMIRSIGDMINSTEYGLYNQGHFVCGSREIDLKGKANIVHAVQFLVDLFFARTEANFSELVGLRYGSQLQNILAGKV